jgi:hypothetical protein
MKNKKLELNVDFIGGQGALSSEEEKALSDYFQVKKKGNKKTVLSKRSKSAKRKLETV